MSDINCALGLSQLTRIDSILESRRLVAEEYRRHLEGIPGVELPVYEMAGADVSWFVYVVRLTGFDRVTRDAVLARLRSQGIACSDYFSPLHLQPHLRRLGFAEGMFPVTEAVSASTVALPFYSTLKRDQIARVAEALRRAIGDEHAP